MEAGDSVVQRLLDAAGVEVQNEDVGMDGPG